MQRLNHSIPLLLLAATASNAATRAQDKPAFHAPIRLQADGQNIATEEPGYACPTLFDANGDGRLDLVVGQFADGKMRIYPRKADGSLAAGQWLQAAGEVAVVPGVW
ncbi:MAG: hypothetical protein AB8H80_07925 [Planctomycetota bacterium]